MNVHSRRGEVDLIMAENQTAIIVEVRQREGHGHGNARDSIDWRKRRRIIHAALTWWQREGYRCYTGLRFDTVTFDGTRTPVWTPHAFDAEGSI